jgi:hypothetical protein
VVEWTWLSLYFNVIQLRSYHSSEVLINLIFARVQLIMPMRIEAGRIAALGIPQDPAPLRMLLGGGRRIGEAQGRHAGKRSTRTRQECAP